MEFRSIGDLSRTIKQNLGRIPQDVDLVVGVPRSGLLAASMVALHTNLPLTDVPGLLAGRLLAPGQYRGSAKSKREVSQCRKALVIDDSILTGGSMRAAQASIADSALDIECLYGAIYGAREADGLCDLIFEHCPVPRMFEWNFMHHPFLAHACVDIDGVLCLDPTERENDDGPRYLEFLANAQPLYQPTQPIGALVSSRLEKYRGQTEAWLARHGVEYGSLHLLDLPSKAARQAAGCHAEFKAQVYRHVRHAQIFIESEPAQARAIARLSGKPVICVNEFKFVREPSPHRIVHLVRDRLRRRAGNLVRQVRARGPLNGHRPARIAAVAAAQNLPYLR